VSPLRKNSPLPCERKEGAGDPNILAGRLETGYNATVAPSFTGGGECSTWSKEPNSETDGPSPSIQRFASNGPSGSL